MTKAKLDQVFASGNQSILCSYVITKGKHIFILLKSSCSIAANNTCIFIMITVMYAPTSLSTVKKRSLPSFTSNLVHPDRTNSPAVCRIARRRGDVGEAKLAAHHVRVIDIPGIITHCAPDSVHADFYPAITSTTIDQTYGRTLYTCVLIVGTIMFTPPTVSAVVQLRLVS